MPQNDQPTTYKREYVKKTLKEPLCPAHIPETTKNLLSSPTFLNLDDSDTDNSKENLDCYLNRFRLENEKIANIYFSQAIDSEAVKKRKLSETYTEYQKNYCDPEKERQLREELLRKKVRLPEDIHIPSTSYQNSFRNPKMIYSGEVKLPPFIPESRALLGRLLDAERISEYTDNIGKFGELSMKRRLLN